MNATEGQEPFDGTDYAQLGFVGIKYQSLRKDFKIGEEVEFTVRGRVVGVGDKEMKDGHVRHVVQVAVDAVRPLSWEDDSEPVDADVDEGGSIFSDGPEDA